MASVPRMRRVADAAWRWFLPGRSMRTTAAVAGHSSVQNGADTTSSERRMRGDEGRRLFMSQHYRSG